MCGGAPQNTNQLNMPKKLAVYGNIIDCQTRSLMAICNYSSEEIELKKIDHLKGDHMLPKYKEINQTGHIPLIEEGHYKVLGGSNIIFQYLAKSKTKIQSKLMPKDQEKQIRYMLGWYFAKMHIPGQQISRIILEGKPSTKESLEKWKEDFYKALSAIDGMLIQSRYLPEIKIFQFF